MSKIFLTVFDSSNREIELFDTNLAPITKASIDFDETDDLTERIEKYLVDEHGFLFNNTILDFTVEKVSGGFEVSLRLL